MKFEIEFWIQINDSYDKEVIEVDGDTRLQALKKAMDENKRGKNFKIIG